MKGISLALGGGGARGFAHVGVITALAREGIPIEELAGTSMGAIVAAYYAVHGNLEKLLWFAEGLTKQRILTFLDPTLPKHGLIKGRKFAKLLEEWFGRLRIEDARIPLAIVATNLRTGKAEIFRRGSLVDTLRASAAIPGLLPAVKIGKEYYVDGGATMQVPVAALRTRKTAKVAVELPILTVPAAGFQQQPSLTEVLSLVYWTQRERSQRETSYTGVILLKPATESFRATLNFHKSKEYMAAGEKAARAALPRIRRALGR